MTFAAEARVLKAQVLRKYGQKGVAARVEGKDDVVFWKSIFEKTLEDRYKVEIYAYSNAPNPNSAGKENVLKFTPFTDKNLVLCVDSDYDYLMQTAEICTNPFVFQTYAYSIENIQCSAENLDLALKMATDTTKNNVDFEKILSDYSEIIYDTLVLSILLSKKYNENDTRCLSKRKLGKEILIQPIFDNIEQELNDFKQKIHLVFQSYFQNITNEEFEECKNELFELGLTEKNAYYFLRGHNFYTVAIGLLDHFQRKIKKAKNTKTSLDLTWQNDNFSFFQKIKNDILGAFN